MTLPKSSNQSGIEERTGIEKLDLSARACNCLKRAGIQTLEDLASLSVQDLLAIQWDVGVLAEIRTRLASLMPNRTLPIHLRPGGEHVRKSRRENQTIRTSDRHETPPADQSPASDEETQTPIAVLGLERRAYNGLMRGGVRTVEALIRMSSEQILNVRNLGEKSLDDIDGKLRAYLAQHPEFEEPSQSKCLLAVQAPKPGKTPIEELGLSTRCVNRLKHAGIETVESLARLPSEQILGLRQVGPAFLAEVNARLQIYVADHPSFSRASAASAKPKPRTLLVDLALLDSVAAARLDKISVNRLALPCNSSAEVTRLGIETIGTLTQQCTDVFDRSSPIKSHLDFYLAWLAGQDEATWADEIAGRGISPLHQMRLKEQAVDQMIAVWLSGLREREAQSIRWYYGLAGSEPLTLEEIGKLWDVTRERVRQIKSRALRKLKRPSDWEAIQPFAALLAWKLAKAGGLMNPGQLCAALQSELTVENTDVVNLVRLVAEVDDDVRWLRKAQAWGLAQSPLNHVVGVQERLVRILEENRTPLCADDLLKRFKATQYFQNRRGELDDSFIHSCLRTHPHIEIEGEALCSLVKWSGRRLTKMILALRSLGEPSHYSLVAEKTNALLPPEYHASAHNIHAHMQRLPDIFVRVGHGIYGLVEWGLEQDRCLADAAFRVLKEAGRPLHIDVITDRVLWTWHVRPSSVQVAVEGDKRFIRIGSGIYWLREHIGTGVDWQSDLDFGDLFGERLTSWQAEFHRESSSEVDTHGEVDMIRRMGLDFFSD